MLQDFEIEKCGNDFVVKQENISGFVEMNARQQSEYQRTKECVDDINIKAWELYPFSPFYMRGHNYSPIDLNERNREVFVKGANYHKNLVEGKEK